MLACLYVCSGLADRASAQALYLERGEAAAGKRVRSKTFPPGDYLRVYVAEGANRDDDATVFAFAGELRRAERDSIHFELGEYEVAQLGTACAYCDQLAEAREGDELAVAREDIQALEDYRDAAHERGHFGRFIVGMFVGASAVGTGAAAVYAPDERSRRALRRGALWQAGAAVLVASLGRRRARYGICCGKEWRIVDAPARLPAKPARRRRRPRRRARRSRRPARRGSRG